MDIIPKLINTNQNICLEINLYNNYMFDVNINRDDFLNWVPFEFILSIEGSEKYIYDRDSSVAFSMEDIKRMITGFRTIIKEKNEKKEIKRLKWGPTEFYFTMNLYETYEINLINIDLWIIVAELTSGKTKGYNRGFSFIVSIEALKTFTDEIEKQLMQLLSSQEQNEKSQGDR